MLLETYSFSFGLFRKKEKVEKYAETNGKKKFVEDKDDTWPQPMGIPERKNVKIYEKNTTK